MKKYNLMEESAKYIRYMSRFMHSSLVDPYSTTMPPKLKKAHQGLDKAVDRCYGSRSFKSDKERIEFLLGLYEGYVGEIV